MNQIERITPTATSLRLSNMELLVSYQTPVAVRLFSDTQMESGEIVPAGTYRTEKKWSVTTSQHINRWAGTRVRETLPQTYFDELYAKI